ncbi:MAG: VOC family protein [Pseudonocardia sp.]|nr:VOC family protein [Pseudonocardia sp.]
MISAVSKIVVPVDDQETAVRFWTDTMGFELVTDQPYGRERWIEVRPPDRGPVLVLSPRDATPRHEPAGDQLPHSDVFFTCTDIQATHAALADRGVKFPTPPVRQDFGWWALFEDPEGTRYALGQD